jgi:hypothetical protein
VTLARRSIGLLGVAVLLAGGGAFAITRGGGSGAPAKRALGGATDGSAVGPRTRSVSTPSAASKRGVTGTRAARRAHRARRHLQVIAPGLLRRRWTVVAWVRGQPAAWLAQRPGVTLMRFDQRRVHLALHAGSADGGVAGWRYGNQITPQEIHLLVATFNGGFKLTYANVGFASGGRVVAALKPGLASIVTYSDGTTGIGAWKGGVPSARRRVFSVLQNQSLLVDHHHAAANVNSCVLVCWGYTIRSLTSVARSGLGITATGALVWAAGEQLSPAQLAVALIGAGAVRAIELDINPAWVAGYLYVHKALGPVSAPVVPGQRGIAGQLLTPYSRDFFAVVAN